jgi:hypothetical protein
MKTDLELDFLHDYLVGSFCERVNSPRLPLQAKHDSGPSVALSACYQNRSRRCRNDNGGANFGPPVFPTHLFASFVAFCVNSLCLLR